MRQAFIHRLGASAPDDVAPLAAAIAERRDPARRHRRDPRQDRGQRLRQRLHPRLRHRRPAPLLERHLPADMAARDPARHVGRHRGRAGAALARARGASPPRAGPGRRSPSARARTPRLEPEEIGRRAQIEAVAEAVRAAMARRRDRRIRPTSTSSRSSARCSPPSGSPRRDAGARRRDPRHAASRWGCRAVPRRSASPAPWARSAPRMPGGRGRRATWRLWSAVASCSAGIELLRTTRSSCSA